MGKSKTPDNCDEDWDKTEIRPRAALRNSNLWKDGKPDQRLISLVQILGRVAAKEHYEAERAAADNDGGPEDDVRRSDTKP